MSSALNAWKPLLSRRDCLRVGALGIAGSVLPLARADSPQSTKAKSVIVLWMAGGVTHIDSFDPKPDAPAEIRGDLKAIPTALSGVQFCETMPHLAKQAHRLALVRSFTSGNDDHFLSQAAALSGRRVTPLQITTEPNVGAVVSKLLGPRSGFPGYLAVPGTTRPGPPPTNEFTGGWLGTQYDPFCTGGQPKNADFTARVKEADEEEFNQQALRPAAGLDRVRLADRSGLREQLDSALRQMEASKSDEQAFRYRAAFEMLLSPAVRQALDLSREADVVREKYGRTKIGQRCLLARRLVEAGARFVLVDYGYDPEFGNLWDNHNAAGQNHPPICKIVKEPYHLAGTDRGVAALLEDLSLRGLLNETLVGFLTEFGRTPKINSNGGRDHWGKSGSIFFAGGGVKAGQVIGSTDRQGGNVTSRPCTPYDVAATIYRALGVDLATTLKDKQNRTIPMLPEGQPIAGIL
jgi:hypothetical protein